MKNLIVTRHEGAIEWLRRQGITGDVVAHATADDVAGRIVYGALPLHLAAAADAVVAIDIPDLPAGKRGHELSADELTEYGATLTRYVVRHG